MLNISKNSLALVGEFLVLANLSAKGHIATLTLGHTKSIDILLTNPTTGKLFKVEVKTTTNGISRSRQFGSNIEWRMDEKHEKIIDKDLFYCFVQVEDGKIDNPRFFIVPSSKVANFIIEDEKYWRSIPRKKEVKYTPMRLFRIGVDEASRGLRAGDYDNRWDYFDK